MKINGLIVSVDYSEFLRVSVPRWIGDLESLTIVTSQKDEATQEIARSHGCRLAVTDLFYRDGATFNKGRAMEWARRHVAKWEDWFLFIDADIIPPRDFIVPIVRAKPEVGFLYSAWRHQAPSLKAVDAPGLPRIRTDGLGVGYFQLFHTSDPAVTGAIPLIDTWWLHAGNYDNRFMDRWRGPDRPDRRRLIEGLELVHVGPRDNWWGKGRKREFDAMQQERRRRGGSWQHERIDGIPVD